MVDIIVFFSLVALIYAVVGVRIIGDLNGETEFDKFSSNFESLGAAFNNLYVLYSNDNYPAIMIPAIKNSPYYLFYFIPFVVINILLLTPIPIAVMF
mmetsp:Transcript_16616/g.14460  ORF Transcript_16616/g.14460 Transcript_16616/m.14460 type:complete len:97 (-) Transcript_16616:239-529(-)